MKKNLTKEPKGQGMAQTAEGTLKPSPSTEEGA